MVLGFGWWRSPVAHLHGVQVVAGSNPVHPTASAEALAKADFYFRVGDVVLSRAVAQSGSVLRSGRRGRWFESSLPDSARHLRRALSFFPFLKLQSAGDLTH